MTLASQSSPLESLRALRTLLICAAVVSVLFAAWIYLQTTAIIFGSWDSTLGRFRWLANERVLDIDQLEKLDSGKFGRDPLNLGEFIIKDPMHWHSTLGTTASVFLLILAAFFGFFAWRVSDIRKSLTIGQVQTATP